MKYIAILSAVVLYLTFPTSAQTQAAPARSPFRAYSSTQYTDHTELFAEYRPLLVNTPGRFTAHLTNVGEVFTPCTDAVVTLTLSMGGKTVWQQTLEHSISQGIYRFQIVAEKAGIGTVTIELKKPAYTEKFTVDSVVVFSDTTTAMVAQSRRPAEVGTGEIGYAKEKSWMEIYATAPVKMEGKTIVVPVTAVLAVDGSFYVMVQSDPEHFRKTLVTTGKRTDHTVVIKGGLQIGDRVVTLGADKIK